MQVSGTGDAGFDAVLCGGFPSERTTAIVGGPGCGKTVLAMQFLIAGYTLYGEPGLIISFEESPEALRRNWTGMRLSLDDVLDEGVHIIDGRIPNDVVETGNFDLGGLLYALTALVEKHRIQRLAIDGIDALFSLGQNAPNRRRELLRLLEWLAQSHVTGLLTMKSDDESTASGVPKAFSFTDFAADGIVQLRSKMLHELARRALRVVKLRGTEYLAGDHPYTISKRGFRVLTSPGRTNMDTTRSLMTRLSTGVERLDRMLAGGYRAGTVTLISGLPGTSKTTLAAEFLWAGCKAGERVQFIGFDEPSNQMICDAGTIGIHLEPYVTSGLMRADSFAAGSAIADDHYLAIEALIEDHQPERVVVDPISALVKAGGPDIADIVSERLAILFKSRGITAVLTAVSDSSAGEIEGSSTRISTIADTWIHLSFAAQHGERNRTLTVVKSRGTPHSNQTREVLIGDVGFTLADVFTGGSEVLLGTARLRHEQDMTLAAALTEQRALLELQTLAEQRDALNKEWEELGRRIEHIDAHHAEIVNSAQARDSIVSSDAQAERTSRFADPRDETAAIAEPTLG
jgi:circadian clock protein KaiC